MYMTAGRMQVPLSCWPSRSTCGIASLRQTTFTPGLGYIAERVETSCWTSLAWWRRLHSVDLWQCVIFRSEVGSHQRARCQRQAIVVADRNRIRHGCCCLARLFIFQRGCFPFALPNFLRENGSISFKQHDIDIYFNELSVAESCLNHNVIHVRVVYE
jgi:hypothetical protein